MGLLPLIPLVLAGVGLFTGAKMVGKMFGSDPDFTQAWMLNSMTGRGGFLKTFFGDGLKSMFLGSRTMSAMFSGMPFGGMMMGGMMGGMMNPMMMGGMGGMGDDGREWG